ncbi:LuxR C-terminal-related transcriptional regulator [Streptomyces sp. NPDC051001]|uniref:response regulator transcription factor n=1 Tax=Streptomyces sp. NPDC051001 TaxID=3155795 RepID=UPI00343FFD18
MIRVAVVDENDIFRRGLVACVETDEALLVVFDARAGPLPERVDVVLASALAATHLAGCGPPKLICGEPGRPTERSWLLDGSADMVLSRTGLTEDQVLAAVHAAACGLLVRPGPSPPTAAPTAGPGHNDVLPERMLDVLRLLADGYGTREIADRIGFSERTVKSVVQQARRRLGARSRAQAVVEGIRRGLI